LAPKWKHIYILPVSSFYTHEVRLRYAMQNLQTHGISLPLDRFILI